MRCHFDIISLQCQKSGKELFMGPYEDYMEEHGDKDDYDADVAYEKYCEDVDSAREYMDREEEGLE